LGYKFDGQNTTGGRDKTSQWRTRLIDATHARTHATIFLPNIQFLSLFRHCPGPLGLLQVLPYFPFQAPPSPTHKSIATVRVARALREARAKNHPPPAPSLRPGKKAPTTFGLENKTSHGINQSAAPHPIPVSSPLPTGRVCSRREVAGSLSPANLVEPIPSKRQSTHTAQYKRWFSSIGGGTYFPFAPTKQSTIFPSMIHISSYSQQLHLQIKIRTFLRLVRKNFAPRDQPPTPSRQGNIRMKFTPNRVKKWEGEWIERGANG